MILFNDALDHLIRIYRILRMDRGHVLLIGSSGNGKKSLSKLAAFTSGNITLELVIFLIVIYNPQNYLVQFIMYSLFKIHMIVLYYLFSLFITIILVMLCLIE